MAVGGRVDTITHNETATSAAQDVVHLPTINMFNGIVFMSITSPNGNAQDLVHLQHTLSLFSPWRPKLFFQDLLPSKGHVLVRIDSQADDNMVSVCNAYHAKRKKNFDHF